MAISPGLCPTLSSCVKLKSILTALALHHHQPARVEQTRQAGSINGLIRVVLVVAGIDFASSLVWCDACAIRWLLKIMRLKEIRLWNAARR